MALLAALDAWLKLHQGKRIIVAYSGGLDSQVLLHALIQLCKEVPVRLEAAHVHHGLSANADDWLRHCQQFCMKHDIFLNFTRCHLQPQKDNSTEMLARKARYDYFAGLMDPHSVLVTAHHQDDQAETVLLQLLRGSGPKGIGGIPNERSFADGQLARPLLSISRAQLESYAAQWQLDYCEDESNAYLSYKRNVIRHQILPLIEQHFPQAKATITRCAQLCAQTDELLQQALQDELNTMLVDNKLQIDMFLSRSHAMQRALLRFWLQVNQRVMPSLKKCDEILNQLCHSGSDSQMKVIWHNNMICRYKNWAILKYVDDKSFPWGVEKIQGRGIRLLGDLTLRTRQGGEKIKMPGGWHKSVKKCLQEQRIPPWERDNIPLVYLKGELVALGNYIPNPHWRVQNPDEWGWFISL